MFIMNQERDSKTRSIHEFWLMTCEVVVYYESRKRELKIRLMNQGRCDERLKIELRNVETGDSVGI